MNVTHYFQNDVVAMYCEYFSLYTYFQITFSRLEYFNTGKIKRYQSNYKKKLSLIYVYTHMCRDKIHKCASIYMYTVMYC